jgi:outer membrane protein OmpA-like peptidoglycan-associated protein
MNLKSTRRDKVMAEATMVKTTISRRSTRVFDGEKDITEAGNTEREARQATDEKEQKAQKPPKKAPTAITIDTPMIPVVDYGKDIYSIFPSSAEDMDEHGMFLARSSSGIATPEPMNFLLTSQSPRLSWLQMSRTSPEEKDGL